MNLGDPEVVEARSIMGIGLLHFPPFPVALACPLGDVRFCPPFGRNKKLAEAAAIQAEVTTRALNGVSGEIEAAMGIDSESVRDLRFAQRAPDIGDILQAHAFRFRAEERTLFLGGPEIEPWSPPVPRGSQGIPEGEGQRPCRSHIPVACIGEDAPGAPSP